MGVFHFPLCFHRFIATATTTTCYWGFLWLCGCKNNTSSLTFDDSLVTSFPVNSVDKYPVLRCLLDFLSHSPRFLYRRRFQNGQKSSLQSYAKSQGRLELCGPLEVEDGMEDEIRKGAMKADTDRLMREYRAQLDAERAQKLSHGRNRSSSKSNDKKDGKDRDLKKPSSKRGKHSRKKSYGSSSSESSSDSSSTEEKERESRRSKLRSKRTKKEKKQRSKSKHPASDGEEHEGPVPLSRFFPSVKS